MASDGLRRSAKSFQGGPGCPDWAFSRIGIGEITQVTTSQQTEVARAVLELK
jgi:hypothetical protein